jgi:hypothetical protein
MRQCNERTFRAFDGTELFFIAHVAGHSGHAVEDVGVIAQSVGAVLDEWGIFTVSLAVARERPARPRGLGVTEPRPWRRAMAWIAARQTRRRAAV